MAMPIISALHDKEHVVVGCRKTEALLAHEATATGPDTAKFQFVDKKMKLAAARLRDLFDFIDANKNGLLTKEELEKGVRKPQARKLASGSGVLSKLFKPRAFRDMDKNKDGLITFQNFMSFALPHVACAVKATSPRKSSNGGASK